MSTFPVKRHLPPKTLIWFPQAPPIMTASQVLKVVCILLIPSILRSCVHPKRQGGDRKRWGVGGRLWLVCEGAVFTYRSLGGGGLLRGASVGGAGLSTGCNCSLQKRLAEKWVPEQTFQSSPTTRLCQNTCQNLPLECITSSPSTHGYMHYSCPTYHTTHCNTHPMLKSTVNTQTFPTILAICWAN